MKKTKKAKSAAKKPAARKVKKAKPWAKDLAKMEKAIQTSLNTLKKDIKNKAPIDKIRKAQNELLLLLGECNYIVREFHDKSIKKKK